MQTPSQPPRSTIGISDFVEDDILDIVEDVLSSDSDSEPPKHKGSYPGKKPNLERNPKRERGAQLLVTAVPSKDVGWLPDKLTFSADMYRMGRSVGGDSPLHWRERLNFKTPSTNFDFAGKWNLNQSAFATSYA
ncbi:unnamed protein product [Chondrus crispus]|uniref:Uncharacterized protein n=1 Tax=Chondrus crispus TaxID=2769 RepID=R7QPP3_CHOCR|nr:unnamed protein product [Chondrus crispus]CDF40059.1 unnamed protein product [Chondrus crispus]|eukprot:XP_005710353.1 unnamed protein product [Chondrus crispus]